MSVLYPEVDDFLEVVMEMCERSGFHVRDAGALASALARPATAVFGQEQYPGLLTKAAVLLDSISRSHPLFDGNKRLAWESSKVICGLNGVRIIAPQEEIDRFVRQVAAAPHMELPDIEAWLESYAVNAAQYAYDNDPELQRILHEAKTSPGVSHKPRRRGVGITITVGDPEDTDE